MAGATQAARNARSSDSASPGPNGGAPDGQLGSARVHGHRQARPRIDRLDRRVGPEGDDRAALDERPPR